MSGRDLTLAALQRRLDALEQELARRRDREEIENLAARYQHYWTAGQGGRIVDELWARRAEDVSSEVGPSGVYIGLERLASYYQKEAAAGRLTVHTMTTPDIQVAGDGRTARGLWLSIGSESDAGELGEHPPKTLQERLLLTSRDSQGRAYRAEWVWQKFAVDFLREDGRWKLWHLHVYELFRCPYQTDWVAFSSQRQALDGLRTDTLFTPDRLPPPGAPREFNATEASTFHWQYAVDAVPVLQPEPLKPYEHWREIVQDRSEQG